MINRKVLIGGIFIAAIILVYLFLLLNGISYRQQSSYTPKAHVEVIPAESIPTADMNLLIITPTSTMPAAIEVNGITARKYVKIQGTEGVGLRIRKEPGIDSDVVFIANESEVFIVIGGPVEKDEILWWELTTPYDETRNGWASADYLEPVADK